MFETLRCRLKGHMFVDSRSMPGTQVCTRCRYRMPFEGLSARAGDPERAPGPDRDPESDR